MKIYGHPWSINTRKVLAALAEKQHPADLELVDLRRGGQHAPEHVRRHPFAKAPVLEHDGFVLYESGAILRYLDRVLPGTALVPPPTDTRAVALLDQWTSVAASYFEAHAHGLIVETIFNRVRAVGDPDAAAIRAHADALARPLQVIDTHLASHAYLAGDSFTLADLVWMPYLEYMERVAAGRELVVGRPNVAAWWARLRERPAWIAVARTGPQPPIGADVASTTD